MGILPWSFTEPYPNIMQGVSRGYFERSYVYDEPKFS